MNPELAEIADLVRRETGIVPAGGAGGRAAGGGGTRRARTGRGGPRAGHVGSGQRP